MVAMIPGEMTEQKACKLFTAENLSVSVFRITSTIHTHSERTTKISSSIRLLFRQNVRDSLSEKCFICIRMNASSTTSKVTHNICLIEIRTHTHSVCVGWKQRVRENKRKNFAECAHSKTDCVLTVISLRLSGSYLLFYNCHVLLMHFMRNTHTKKKTRKQETTKNAIARL